MVYELKEQAREQIFKRCMAAKGMWVLREYGGECHVIDIEWNAEKEHIAKGEDWIEVLAALKAL